MILCVPNTHVCSIIYIHSLSHSSEFDINWHRSTYTLKKYLACIICRISWIIETLTPRTTKFFPRISGPRSNQTSLLTVTALCFNFWRNVRMFAIPESSLMWFFKWYKGHVAAEGVPKGQNLTSQPLLSKSLKEFIGQTGTLMINACLQMI